MRSKSSALLLLLVSAVALPRCDSESNRIVDICVTLERCTGYVESQLCAAAITEAIGDRRMATSAVARCARCLGDHAPAGTAHDVWQAPAGDESVEPGACIDVLDSRRCDVACADVSFVLDARTSTAMRQGMCKSAAFCGVEHAEQFCSSTTQSALTCHAPPQPHRAAAVFEAQLDFDDAVDTCRKCLVKPDDGDGHLAETRAASCELLVAACAESCRKLRSVSPILTTAKTVLEVCKFDACFAPPPGPGDTGGGLGDGGSGGASHSGGTETGGAEHAAGGAAAITPTPCFERVLSWLGPLHNESAAEACGVVSGGAGGGAGGSGGADDRESQGGAGPEEVPTPTAHQEQLEQCANCIALKDCAAVAMDCATQCKDILLGGLQ